MAMRSFDDAIVSHERYNASAWQDLDQNPNPNRTIIAFLDIDACRILHWPIFNGLNLNSDTEGGRWPMIPPKYNICPAIDKAMQSSALMAPDSRLVVLSCYEFGPIIQPCLRADRNHDSNLYSKLIVGHMSALKKDTHPHDFGLPPWPTNTVTLSQKQMDDIETRNSTSRTLLFSFIGRPRIQFPQFHEYLHPLHGTEGVHAVFTFDHYKSAVNGMIMPVSSENQTRTEFHSLLMSSVFAGAPLGDCAYSVRFSEILSSGAIPVVFSDNWVLPYNLDVVDWSKVAVILPQRRVNETLAILRAIPNEERCTMRRNGYHFYKYYMADVVGRLRAVLQIVDAGIKRRRQKRQADGNSITSNMPMEFSFVPDR